MGDTIQQHEQMQHAQRQYDAQQPDPGPEIVACATCGQGVDEDGRIECEGDVMHLREAWDRLSDLVYGVLWDDASTAMRREAAARIDMEADTLQALVRVALARAAELRAQAHTA